MLRNKLLVSYLLLTLASALATGLLVRADLREARDTEERAELLALADFVDASTQSLRGDDRRSELHAEVARASRFSGRRVTVIEPQGAVLADSDRDPAQAGNHAGRPEVAAARPGAPATSIRRSGTIGKDYFYLAKVSADGFYIRVAAPLEPVYARLSQLNVVLLTGLGVGSVFAVLLGAFVAARLTGRIGRQLTAAARIAEGDLQARVDVVGDDELDRLGRALNRVAERLDAQIVELTARRNEIADVLDATADGLISINRDDVVTHVNSEAARLFESAAAAVGRPYWETVRDAALPDLVSRVRANLRPAEAELSTSRPSSRREIEARVSPIHGADGSYAGAVLAFRDVTRLRRLEVVRRDFVANVSHEMKTPLTSILGSVETLRSGGLDDREAAVEFLAKVDRNARRLANLVTDLLVLSRLEGGGDPLPSEPVLADDVVSESAAAVADQAREKGVALALPPMNGALAVRGDADLLSRALVNLLENAVAYTPSGGRIDVEIRLVDGRVEFGVADTGIGIPAREIERIFERFYRVDKARSRALGGTGLGLAIVRHVAERHGGSIRVRSEEGRGSTFTLSLPMFDEAGDATP